ncbi:unnamed protein product, partial [Amoebophrya sp. A25]
CSLKILPPSFYRSLLRFRLQPRESNPIFASEAGEGSDYYYTGQGRSSSRQYNPSPSFNTTTNLDRHNFTVYNGGTTTGTTNGAGGNHNNASNKIDTNKNNNDFANFHHLSPPLGLAFGRAIRAEAVKVLRHKKEEPYYLRQLEERERQHASDASRKKQTSKRRNKSEQAGGTKMIANVDMLTPSTASRLAEATDGKAVGADIAAIVRDLSKNFEDLELEKVELCRFSYCSNSKPATTPGLVTEDDYNHIFHHDDDHDGRRRGWSQNMNTSPSKTSSALGHKVYDPLSCDFETWLCPESGLFSRRVREDAKALGLLRKYALTYKHIMWGETIFRATTLVRTFLHDIKMGLIVAGRNYSAAYPPLEDWRRLVCNTHQHTRARGIRPQASRYRWSEYGLVRAAPVGDCQLQITQAANERAKTWQAKVENIINHLRNDSAWKHDMQHFLHDPRILIRTAQKATHLRQSSHPDMVQIAEAKAMEAAREYEQLVIDRGNEVEWFSNILLKLKPQQYAFTEKEEANRA